MFLEEGYNKELERNVRKATEIFSEHGAFLMQVFRRELDEHDACDLWQNLYVSLVRNPLADNLRNVRGYLYRAANHDIVDFRRKIKLRRQKIDEYSIDRKVKKAVNDPVLAMMARESLMTAFSLVETRFPPSISQAVLYKRRDGLKNGEIAERMGIKKQTVENYLSIGTTMINEFKDEILGDDNG